MGSLASMGREGLPIICTLGRRNLLHLKIFIIGSRVHLAEKRRRRKEKSLDEISKLNFK